MSDPLENAILRTLHYSDIFEYPLTTDELCRYLIGRRARHSDIRAALHRMTGWNPQVLSVGPYLTLPRRLKIIGERIRLHERAQKQMRRARWYGRLLGYMPFVRMVALTGALAMQNARDDDADFLIVSAPGRLWTVRAIAVVLVHLARLRGDQLCPNFLLTETRLAIGEQDLYSAHEVVQMIPLYGSAVYRQLRQSNGWVERFLPNADGVSGMEEVAPLNSLGAFLKREAERLLGGRLGRALERWEMKRKIRKLSAQTPANADGVEFSAEACRGFFSGHGRRVLAEFDRRTRALEPVLEGEARLTA